jgi:hypothetical protein
MNKNLSVALVLMTLIICLTFIIRGCQNHYPVLTDPIAQRLHTAINKSIQEDILHEAATKDRRDTTPKGK